MMIERKIKNKIKDIAARFGYEINRIAEVKTSDKIVSKRIGKFSLLMRDDHKLPLFLKNLPYYSKNLPRLAKELDKKYPHFSMIDVGANIGDTVALVRSECQNVSIFCIDGDGDFFSLLEKNMKQFKNVKIFKQLLGEKMEIIQAELSKNIETARIQYSKGGSRNEVSILPLDKLIEKHNEVGKSKLLKIDTDGYDMKIVRGSLGYLAETKPVIFLEYDPVFFTEQGEIGVSTLLLLEDLGYEDIIFYDNLGNLILSGKLSNHLLLKQMNNYIDPKLRAPFPYYDIALFHKDDKDVAENFIEKEMEFFYSNGIYAK